MVVHVGRNLGIAAYHPSSDAYVERLREGFTPAFQETLPDRWLTRMRLIELALIDGVVHETHARRPPRSKAMKRGVEVVVKEMGRPHKLSYREEMEICDLHKHGMRLRYISKHYGIAISTVYRIAGRRQPRRGC
jgi:hypothetical protein